MSNFDKTEHSAKYKKQCWDAVFKLQNADGPSTSALLQDYAKQHICGCITLREIKEKLQEHYGKNPEQNNADFVVLDAVKRLMKQ